MPKPSDTTRVAMPGTCGELVQGMFEGVHCLVSCPIAHYSIAEVSLHTESSWNIQPDYPKVRSALQHGLAFLNQTASGGEVHLKSKIIHGRGYGSSTADIGALLAALSGAFELPMTPAEIAQLALCIEPTDSSLFPGLTLWDHRQGRRCELWGPAPAMMVVVLDPGGAVDTIAYNQRDHRAALQTLTDCHREAFTLLRYGLEQSDRHAIGAAASMSAKAHQVILPNPLLDAALQLAKDVDAFGVCRAHSGTILGLLLDPDHPDIHRLQAIADQYLSSHVEMSSLPMVSGGPRVLRNGETAEW